jgi:putative transcriptional regulator
MTNVSVDCDYGLAVVLGYAVGLGSGEGMRAGLSNSGSSTVVPEIDHEAGQEVGQEWVPAERTTEEELYAAALADPDAQPLELLLAQGRLRRLVNVKRLRERLGLTQEEFAKTYWIPLGTLRGETRRC